VLAYLSGGEGEVVLAKKLMKMGKDSACDIPVSGFGVGQTAATISMRPNGYFLSYVEGISKPKVNGSAVKQSVKLNEFDVIETHKGQVWSFTTEGGVSELAKTRVYDKVGIFNTRIDY